MSENVASGFCNIVRCWAVTVIPSLRLEMKLYRFESCPDYSIVFYFLIMQIGAREGIFCLATAVPDVIFSYK